MDCWAARVSGVLSLPGSAFDLPLKLFSMQTLAVGRRVGGKESCYSFFLYASDALLIFTIVQLCAVVLGLPPHLSGISVKDYL